MADSVEKVALLFGLGQNHSSRTTAERLLLADSVEKVALLFGLGQNHSIGQRENTQHDGTVIEWAGAAVLLVQH
ncbi:hypothetical protein [Pseudomonas amygdali]|uniref:hypothetical protein n=1 Tax=Pseudomonas amygdali TaxID=47877 RepID=UPI0015D4F0FF|nr:hypothetical protein [Pseudomonas amygdali]